MATLAEKLELYKSKLEELSGVSKPIDEALLEEITRGLGPSIYKLDSELVATSDKAEMDRIKQNYLIGKLDMSPNDDLDAVLDRATQIIGSSNPRKYRSVYYYIIRKG